MTFPLADPAFNNANIAALSEAEKLLADHWGHGYRNPISASGERPRPIPPSPGVLTPAEIELESARIELMIANHRWKRAHGGSQ